MNVGDRVRPTEEGKRRVKCLGDGRVGTVRRLGTQGIVYVQADGQTSWQPWSADFWEPLAKENASVQRGALDAKPISGDETTEVLR